MGDTAETRETGAAIRASSRHVEKSPGGASQAESEGSRATVAPARCSGCGAVSDAAEPSRGDGACGVCHAAVGVAGALPAAVTGAGS